MAIWNLVHDLLPGASDTSASHVLLFFDIANMFNSVSQKSSQHELEQTMPLLLLSFDTWYQNANLCWYKQLDGCWAHFEMNDRFPQGNELSSFLACLTLQAIINTLHRDLMNQPESCTTLALCTRSNLPSTPTIGAYIDDLSYLVPSEDSVFAFDHFDELDAT
jgi:hypothetical protein